MSHCINLQTLLSQMPDQHQQMTSFALLCLGMIESLTSGTIGASDAIQCLFHADNCLYVRKRLKQKTADKIMSHGVQLHDLFETLPVDEAQQEFQRELTLMHHLCLELLATHRAAA